MLDNRSASRAWTPEEYFIPKPNPEKEVPVDALLVALNRVQTVLFLLRGSAEDGEGQSFTINHKSVIDALWCIDGLVEQAVTMVEHSVGIGEVKV